MYQQTQYFFLLYQDLTMIFIRVKINNFSRRPLATLLSLSLVTTIGIFSPISELPNSKKAMACLPGLDTTEKACKTVAVTEQAERENMDISRQFFIAPFNQGNEADVLRALLIAVNFVIVVRLLFQGYRAWFRNKTDEEF